MGTWAREGKEGIVRLVKHQTARGELIRSIHRLYPLEMTNYVADNTQAQVFKNRPPTRKESQQREISSIEPVKEIKEKQTWTSYLGTRKIALVTFIC